MNKQPIEQARDRDLRLSHVALRRAALGAHEMAKTTGTTIVVSRDGVIQHLRAEPSDDSPQMSTGGAGNGRRGAPFDHRANVFEIT